MGDIIVYDLETKETFADVGSRDPRKLHISLLGAYSYTDNRYYSYTEDELPQFFRRLEQCDLIIGFNNKGFDDQVLSTYFPEISKVPSFDILEQFYNSAGFRVKLDNIAHATLGTGKSGDGLKAIALFRDGKIEELRAYCLDDVKITKEIYDFGKSNGFVKYSNLQGEREVDVNFTIKVEKAEQPMNLSLF